MSKEFQKRLEKLPKLNSKQTKQKTFDLPEDYVVTKFYELGYKVTHNRYSNTYNSCCPICKEGKSWGKKKRCFYIPENKNIYCHNCGASHTPYNWIREVSGMSDDELRKDMGDTSTNIDLYLETKEFKKKKSPQLPEDSINLFDKNQVEYYKDNNIVDEVLKYIRKRRLENAVNAPHAFYVSLKDFVHKNRLIIPFRNTEGKIIYYQSRQVFDWDSRESYLSKSNSDKSIFGIDRVDPSLDSVFIFEGPLDACFVRNGVAVAGINEGHHRFTHTQEEQLEELKFFNKVWVLDNQWIDKAAREKTTILLEQGECVFVWPEKFSNFKDFNQLCIFTGRNEIKHSFIRKNALCGKEGLLKYKVLTSRL